MDPFGTFMRFMLMWWYTTGNAACGSNVKQGGQTFSSTSGSSCMPILQRNDRKRGSTSTNARITCTSKHYDVFWTGMACMTAVKHSLLRSLLTLCPLPAAVSIPPCRYTPKAKTDIESYGAGLFVPSTPSPVDAGCSRAISRSSSSSSSSNKDQQAERRVLPKFADLFGPGSPGYMRSTVSSKARSLGMHNKSSTHTLSSASAAAHVDRVRKATPSAKFQDNNGSRSKAQEQDINTKLRTKLKQVQELRLTEAKASKAQLAAVEAERAQQREKIDQQEVELRSLRLKDEEMTALKAKLAAMKAKFAAMGQEATLLQATKTEVEQKLLLQVEATKAALQAQAETRAALAAVNELNQKLLAQQKADRAKAEQKKLLQAEPTQAARQALTEAQAALTASQDRIQDLLEQQKDDRDALAALQHEVDVEKRQSTFFEELSQNYLLEIGVQRNKIRELTPDAAYEGKVRSLERELDAAKYVIDQQQDVLGEQLWKLEMQQQDGYEVFMDAVDRQGRVSEALEKCMLDSREILNTPAAALCIAAGLANSSHSSVQRVYRGLSMGCHSDHVGGDGGQQQQLNRVWGELQRVFAPAAAH